MKKNFKRDHVAPVRLSEKERFQLTELSRQSGVSREAVVRRLIMGQTLRVKPPETYAQLVRQVAAVGNNINQIAHIANADQRVSPEQVQETLRLMREVWQMVRDAG